MHHEPWQIPPEWERLDLDRLKGLVMVIGAPDSGKSVFVEYLASRLGEGGRPPAVVDGDPGQSRLGPPATLTLSLPSAGGKDAQTRHAFVGAVSPRGHMLEILTGTARLVRAARRTGAETILHDTSGLIDPDRGGHALKRAKIDLLRPAALIALSRQRELEKLLIPLRRSRRVRVIDLPVSAGVRPRDTAARKAHRARRFAAYFSGADPRSLIWPRYGVVPEPRFSIDDLVGLEDREGICMGLGIVAEVQPEARRVILRTPVRDLRGIDTLRIGDLHVDPETFEDRQLRR